MQIYTLPSDAVKCLLTSLFLYYVFSQIADFGLAQASKDGSVCFEPVNTEIRGTPGIKFFSSLYLS